MMTGTSGRAAFAFGSSSSPVIPGMLMSDRIRISDAAFGVADALQRVVRGLRKFHGEAAGAQLAPELLAKQHLDIRLVVDHENEQAHAVPPATWQWRCGRARKNDPEFGELAGLGIDLDRCRHAA